MSAPDAASVCPWKDTDHLANPESYCAWCDGYTAALDALRSLPVEHRMKAMGMVAYGEVTWDDEGERDVVIDPVDVLPGTTVYVDEAWVWGVG